MVEEKEYGLLIAAIVAIVSIVGLVILFSRGNPTGGILLSQMLPGATVQSTQKILGSF